MRAPIYLWACNNNHKPTFFFCFRITYTKVHIAERIPTLNLPFIKICPNFHLPQLSNSGMKPNNIHITFLISLFIRTAFLYVCGMMIKKPKNIRFCLWLWKNILYGLIMGETWVSHAYIIYIYILFWAIQSSAPTICFS